MKLRKLGNAGPDVSVVGLGCNNFGLRIDLEASRKVIHKAIDLGITLFDTADTYGQRGGSETILGEVLGENRKRIVLATKFGGAMDEAGTMKGASRHYVTLRRRGQPQAPPHRLDRSLPDSFSRSRHTHRGNAARPRRPGPRWQSALHRLLEFCRLAACRRAMDGAASQLHGFVSCQNEYSLLVRGVERELLPAMQKFGLGMLPYFPLASGLLTGKYAPNQPIPENTRFQALKGLADRYLTESNWKIVQEIAEFLRRARPHAARSGLCLAPGAPDRRQRHRRRHQARTVGAKREGRRKLAHSRRDRRNRYDHRRSAKQGQDHVAVF